VQQRLHHKTNQEGETTMTTTTEALLLEAITNEIRIIWHIDDVREVRPDLTDDEAREVLAQAKKAHDATIGINWDVLGHWADYMFPALVDE
jgi:phosphoenolpyruvate carboxylase